MGFNFPTPATENQEFTPVAGLTYIYKAPRWMVKGTAVVPVTDGDKGDVVVSGTGTVWTLDPAVQTANDARYVNIDGDTMSGNLTINNPLGNSSVVLENPNAVGNVGTVWWSRATKTRWVQWVNSGESTGNVGSDLIVARYDDAGAYVGQVYDIKRSTGVVNFAVAPTVAGAALASPPGGSTTQVQFNDGGAFNGDAGMVYDKANDKLTVAGVVSVANGTAAVPGLSFASSASSGVYWATGVGIAYGGASKLLAGSTTTTSSQPILNATGTVSAPSYSFTNNPNSGLWLNGTSLEVTVNSVTRLAISTAAVTSTLTIAAPAGTQALPSITVGGDTATGLFRKAANTLAISANNFEIMSFAGSGLVSCMGYFNLNAGTATATSLRWGGANTGLYGSLTNIAAAISGTERLNLTATALTTTVPVVLPADPTANLEAATKQYVDAKPSLVTMSDTAPGSPVDGQLWFNTSLLKMFIRYNDGTSTQWVQT